MIFFYFFVFFFSISYACDSSVTSCPEGSFGPPCCMLKCNCENNGACNGITGACLGGTLCAIPDSYHSSLGWSGNARFWGGHCQLPYNCSYDKYGRKYAGNVNFGSRSTCQRWSDVEEQAYIAYLKHSYFPDVTFESAGLFCRNPDYLSEPPSKQRPWCVTSVSMFSTEWEYCTMINLCSCPPFLYDVENNCNQICGRCLEGCHDNGTCIETSTIPSFTITSTLSSSMSRPSSAGESTPSTTSRSRPSTTMGRGTQPTITTGTPPSTHSTTLFFNNPTVGPVTAPIRTCITIIETSTVVTTIITSQTFTMTPRTNTTTTTTTTTSNYHCTN